MGQRGRTEEEILRVLREAEAPGGGLESGPARIAGDRRKKVVKPRLRHELAEWAQAAHRMSQRRVAGLIPVERGTLRYRHRRDRPE